MSIIAFVESLGDEISNPDILIKTKALKKLSDYLSGLSFSSENSESVSSLTEFYVINLSQHYDLLPPILDGLSIIIDFINFSDENAKRIVTELVQVDVPQLQQPVRLAIYRILNQLFNYHLDYFKNSLNDDFVTNYINAIDGENSPDCVYLVMDLSRKIAENLNIDRVYEEFFESISIYFPVEIKTSKIDNGNMTREKFAALNKQCLIASPLFGPQLLPLLLGKITSDKKSARIDSLDVLKDCLPKMHFDDILNYHRSFLDCLNYEIKLRDDECHQLALTCLEALSNLFQEKASEKELLEFCWHIFELTNGVIADKKLLKFLLAAADGKSRVWCGIMASLLPSLMEKALKLEMEDTEALEVIMILLSAEKNLANYRGLMDSSISKQFFFQTNQIFNEMSESETLNENQERLAVVFQLLACYSLFNIWISEVDSGTNFTTDSELIMESRCTLLRKSIESLAKDSNSFLEKSLLSTVPLFLQSLSSDSDNALIKIVFSYTDSPDVLRNFSYRVLESVPINYLDVVLAIIGSQIHESTRDPKPAMFCFAMLVNRFANDPIVTDKLCIFAKELLDGLIDSEGSLSKEVVSILAVALSDLGASSDDGYKSDLIKLLLFTARSNELCHPSVIWLCAMLGQSPIQVIRQTISISELLNILNAMIICAEDAELRSILYQTYASIINKIDDVNEVENNFNNHLSDLDINLPFVLWNLKAAMMAGHSVLCDKLIRMITNPETLSGNLGPILSTNIEILLKKTSDDRQHFCSDSKLFPKQNPFYEQQSFYRIAQPFKDLATDSKHSVVKDISMEIYLKLIESYPKHVIELSIDEIIDTVSQWFSALDNKKVSLRLGVLKAICNLHSQDNRLSQYIEDIAENIFALCDFSSSLEPKDRWFLAKVIGWFVLSFPNYDTVKYFAAMKSTLNKLVSDKKRVVRMEAAKSKMVLFC